MANVKNGSVDSAQTVKAGCGIRYDPDALGEDSGFDFSEAKSLKFDVDEELLEKPSSATKNQTK